MLHHLQKNKNIASNSVPRQDNSESESLEEEVTISKPKKIKAAVHQQNSELDIRKRNNCIWTQEYKN